MTKIPVYEPFAFAEQLARLGPGGDVTEVLQQPTPEGERARFLRKVLFSERGPDRDLVEADAGMIARLKELAAIAPNFEAAVGVVSRAAQLAMQTRRPLEVPPLLLIGPAGVGKTFFARAVAKAVGTNYAEVAMNQVDDAGALVGHSLSWRAARPGIIARTLLEGPSASPVIFADEIDKSSWREQGDAIDVFHSLLECESSKAFVDAFIEAPVRADRVLWVLAANDTGALRPSLLDRMLPLPIEPPTAGQRAIVIRSVYANVVSSYRPEFAADIGGDVIDALADATPRQTRRLLQLALGYAAERRRRRLAPDDVRRASRQLTAGVQKPCFGFRPSR
jgi:ATP-dependent Lon protease